MAPAPLTERQQQIVGLLDQNKTPREIAAQLEITENGVYQHIRRIRDGGHKVNTMGSARAGQRNRSRSTGRQSASRAAPRPTPAPVASEPRDMTPLQAIRARKSKIENERREAGAAVTQAERAWKAAQEAAAKVDVKTRDELDQLLAAEAALTGKPAPKRASSPRKRNTGSRAAANGSAAPAPEPAPTPDVAPAPSQDAPAPTGTEAAPAAA